MNYTLYNLTFNESSTKKHKARTTNITRSQIIKNFQGNFYTQKLVTSPRLLSGTKQHPKVIEFGEINNMPGWSDRGYLHVSRYQADTIFYDLNQSVIYRSTQVQEHGHLTGSDTFNGWNKMLRRTRFWGRVLRGVAVIKGRGTGHHPVPSFIYIHNRGFIISKGIL